MITQVCFTWDKGNTFRFKTILSCWDLIDFTKSKLKMDLSTKEIQSNQSTSLKLQRKQRFLQTKEDKNLPMEQMLALFKYCCIQIMSTEILIDLRELRKSRRIKLIESLLCSQRLFKRQMQEFLMEHKEESLATQIKIFTWSQKF